MRKITKERYEAIKKMGFYKNDLGHNFHLCTIYSVAGNKEQPWWKRLLSHVYIITRFEVIDEKEPEIENPVSEEIAEELKRDFEPF